MKDQLTFILKKYANILKDEVKNELNRPRPHAPGYNRNAYSQGRNPRFKINAPISKFGFPLNESVEAKVRDNQIFLEMEDYYIYQDQGVTPQPQYLEGQGSGGNSPFISSLRKWASSRGISDPLGAAFAIRRNIWKFGIAPTNFLGDAIDNMSVILEDEMVEDIDELIDTILDNILINE